MRLPNGFGSVHKLPGNRRNPYRVRITIGWKLTNENHKTQEYKTIGYFATKEEGLIALSNFNNSPYNLEAKDITFKEVYKLWSSEHYKTIVNSTKRMWEASYNHSVGLYNMKFRCIKVSDLENTIKNADVGSSTKLRMKNLYNMMYKYAIKHEIVDKNYAELCKAEKCEKIICREPFALEEINKLWQNINIPFVDMILINLYSGLRPKELVELKILNINLKEKIMIGGLKTRAGRDRKIPIHEKIYPLILKRYNENNERLCLKENGEYMSYDDYRNRFNKIMKKLNMNHKPHDTRHTFITIAKHSKIDEYILKLIVGHKIQDITENIYTHRNQNELIKAIKKLKM